MVYAHGPPSLAHGTVVAVRAGERTGVQLIMVRWDGGGKVETNLRSDLLRVAESAYEETPARVADTTTNEDPETRRRLGQLVALANIVPLAHAADPATAKTAAARTAEHSDSQAARLLFHLCAWEPDGATYWELEDRLDMRSAKQRLSGLKQAKLVYADGRERPTWSGSEAQVYRPAGLALNALCEADELDEREWWQ